MFRWIRVIARFLGCLFIILFAVAAVGACFPAIPVLGSIGLLLVSPFGSWLVLLSLVGVAINIVRWRRRQARSALAMAIIAGGAALGIGTIEARQIAVAHDNDIHVDLARTLWLGSVPHTSAPPVLATYGGYAGQSLQLVIYRPIGSKAGGPGAPVIVYVHGGGWSGGTIHDRQPDMRWFADRGYLVMSVGYTLSSETQHTWNVAEPQIGCALAWIGANASRLGGDPARLALFGESAGGNLVLNVAYSAASGELRPACPGDVPHIAAVIAPYPVLDPVRMYQNRDAIAGPFARQMTIQYTGGSPDRYPERYTAVSSASHIKPGAPPTLLIPALADHLLPPDVAFQFAAKAKEAGIDMHVIPFPFGEHSFDQMSGSIGDQIVRQATVQFLRKKGLGPVESR